MEQLEKFEYSLYLRCNLVSILDFLNVLLYCGYVGECPCSWDNLGCNNVCSLLSDVLKKKRWVHVARENESKFGKVLTIINLHERYIGVHCTILSAFL